MGWPSPISRQVVLLRRTFLLSSFTPVRSACPSHEGPGGERPRKRAQGAPLLRYGLHTMTSVGTQCFLHYCRDCGGEKEEMLPKCSQPVFPKYIHRQDFFDEIGAAENCFPGELIHPVKVYILNFSLCCRGTASILDPNRENCNI